MISYKIAKRKNPRSKEVTFHPAIVTPNPVNRDKLIQRIEKKCTLSSSDVKAVLDALEVELIDALHEGNAVRLGDLGSFRPSLRTKGVKTEEECNATLVKSVRVVFNPSLRIKRDLDVKKGLVKFQKTEVLALSKKKKPKAAVAPEAGGGATPAAPATPPASSAPSESH